MTQEAIIATASVVIAAAAFFIAVWQGFLMRRHNRLSVRPCLRIDRHQVFGEPITVNLQNTGVGPAFIKSFEIRVDGNPITGDIDTRMRTFMRLLDLEGMDCNFFTPFEGEAIATGENQKLIEIISPYRELTTYKRIISVFPRLTFSICYTSIYSEEFCTTY